MMKILMTLWTWVSGFLSRMWDGKDHSVEIKLIAYAAAVVSTIAWLSLSLSRNQWKINSDWNWAFLYFLLMVSAGVGIQAWSVRPPKGSNDESQK